MKGLELSIQDIKDIIGVVAKNNVGGFKLQDGDFCIEIEGQRPQVVSAPVQASAAVLTHAQPGSANEVLPEISGNMVKSPIVGTFYSAPAPDKPVYVSVGSEVKRGDVLFIIESMKLMNEVTSEFDGVVTEILVENSQGVEYGQPILVIK